VIGEALEETVDQCRTPPVRVFRAEAVERRRTGNAIDRYCDWLRRLNAAELAKLRVTLEGEPVAKRRTA